MILAGTVLAAFVASVISTGWVRRYAMSRALLDVPNARSSHFAPTPRGGGLAVVVVCFMAWTGTAVVGWSPAHVVGWLSVGSILVAGVGFLDDRGHVPVARRMLVHLAAAATIALASGGVQSLTFGDADIQLGVFGYLLAILGVTWVLNLYNFMDGIDGIAAVEAVSVSFGAAAILWLNGEIGFALLSAALGAASLGFLWWNWPPAKIFMGDVGSGFLGFVMASLALFTNESGALSLWVWLVLLGVFIVDATFTLLRRLIRRQRVYEAHRSHAYQRAAIAHNSHGKVTVGVLLINVLWLLPIAGLVAYGHLAGILGLIIAYVPLIFLVFFYRAGADTAETGFRVGEM